MDTGWITVHRKLLDSAIFSDPLALKLWIYLLLKANHKKGQYIIGNTVIEIPRGSLLTGRKALSKATDIHESKIQRVLKLFEMCDQIEQQTRSKYRLISITNYDSYQNCEQQVNSKRTASEQQVNTNNNENNVDNGNNKEKTRRFTPPSHAELQNYINEKKLSVDPEGFILFYESKGWKVGNNKMKDWKASARGWHSRNKNNGGNYGQRKESASELHARKCASAFE